MLRERIFRSKFLALGLICSFLALFVPIEALAQGSVTEGSMIGFIYGEDMATPVENAVVKIRNMENSDEFQSAPTDKDGIYRIKDVAEGRYILGVSTPQGDFNFEYMILVKAGEMAKLSLALKPGLASALGGEKGEKEGKKKKKAFFLTPLGIAVIVVGSAVVIYGTYKLLQELEIISRSKK